MVNYIVISILFVLPVILIYKKIISFKHKIFILYIVTFLLIGVIIAEKWNLSDLGLDPLINSDYIVVYLVFTTVLSTFIYFLAKLEKRRILESWWTDKHFIYGFILVSFLQEFIFRGFLVHKLSEIFVSPIVIILISAILFAFMHIIYSDNFKIILILFLGGIAFTAIYIYFPSLMLISVSHMVLNFLIVIYGYLSNEKLNAF